MRLRAISPRKDAPMAAYQYIYVMKGLSKVYPGGREVLKDIWLSFLPGAKIGVLGPNGAGKSTLLRIMAGADRDFTGEAWPAAGARVGYLPQEPVLDPDKDVFGNIAEGLAETRALVERFETLSARFAEDLSPAEMEALCAEQGALQEQIERAGGWELDRTIEIAMDALRCPPPGAAVASLSGGERRRVALCRLLLQRPDPIGAAGNLIARSKSPWMRCVARPPGLRLQACPAASGAAWRCAGSCCSVRICCCSTSRPIISTPNRWPGCSAFLRRIPAPSSP